MISQSGIEFGGAKVVVSIDRGKTFNYSDNIKSSNAVERYKELVENAKIEHGETLEGSIDSSSRSSGLEPDEDVTQDIALNVIDDIEDLVEEREGDVLEQSRGILVTEQDVREFSGLLDPKGSTDEKIEALEITANQYRLKALNEPDLVRSQFYKNVREVAELKADAVRMAEGLKPEHEEAIGLVEREIENNDLTRLERFKKWAKENMLGFVGCSDHHSGYHNHCHYRRP